MKLVNRAKDWLTVFNRKRYAKKHGLVLTTTDPLARGRIYTKAVPKLVEIKVIRADGTVEIVPLAGG